MKKIRIFLTCILLAVSATAFAQNLQVKGTVTDAGTGEGVAFASIQVEGTMIGTSSDADGNYAISAPANAKLVFSFVGYKTAVVAVDGKTKVNCALAADTEMLEETVVVAYGTQSAKTVTASVASIKADAIKDLPNVSVDGMLQGQAAGVQIATANAGSGQAASIHIRGISSISGGTDPLYVIDGMPMSTSAVNANYTDINPIADINPADILSIEVLKDAAATALYGSRAANGVIMITTKNGRKGEMSVTYDGNVGVQTPTKMFDVMDAQTYTNFKNLAVFNAKGKTEVDLGGGENIWGTNAFNLMRDKNGNIIDTDWAKQIYQNGLIHNHTLAIQGGNDKVQYYISGNYAKQDGIVMGDSYERMGVKANVTSQINKWLKVGINAQYSHGKTSSKDGSRIGSVFAAAGLSRMAIIMPSSLAGYGSEKIDEGTGKPYFDTTDPSYYTMNGGQYIGTGGIRLKSLSYPNPMTSLENFNNQISDRIIATTFAQVTPIKNLNIKTQFGIDHMMSNEETYWDALYGQGANYPGYAWRTYSNNTDWTWTNTINYGLHFGENTFDFLVGMEAYSSGYEYDYINASEMLNTLYDGFKAGYSKYDAGGTYGKKTMISYFGRINYDYKAKYMVSANYRRDGLSSLGTNSKWGNFWGVSAAWRISEEGFFDSIRDVISELKIKGSYGVVGNSQIGYYNSQSYYSDAIYGGTAALGLANIGDSNLAWESSNKLDVGLEFALFNNVTVGFDYYNTKSNNLVMAVPQGPSTGIGSLVTNAGSMKNEGIELTISADVIKNKNFKWYTSFNFTTVDNKVLSLAEGVDQIYGESESNLTMPGYSMGQLYLYPTGGIDPETGRRIFFGSNGEWTSYDPATKAWYLKDGTLFQGEISQVRAGNTIPTWYGGWTNTFNFYGFDVNLMFQYSGGNWIFNGNTATGSDMRWWNNFSEVAEKCWKNPGDNAKYARPFYGDNVSNGSAYDITDWVEKGDYLRLKNVSLGYTFKFKKEKSGLSSLRLYGQVQNAFVLTAYTGLDPELTSSYTTDAVHSSGYDKNTLPQARTFTFGAQIKF